MRERADLGTGIAAFALATLLVACATPPLPPPVATAPPPRPLPALALLTAENQGYVEGLAAGERIQARHDQARALEQQAKAVPIKPPAPQAIVPAPPTKTAVVAPAKPLPELAPQISYVPVGPATPVASPAAPGNCSSGFAGCD